MLIIKKSFILSALFCMYINTHMHALFECTIKLCDEVTEPWPNQNLRNAFAIELLEAYRQGKIVDAFVMVFDYLQTDMQCKQNKFKRFCSEWMNKESLFYFLPLQHANCLQTIEMKLNLSKNDKSRLKTCLAVVYILCLFKETKEFHSLDNDFLGKIRDEYVIAYDDVILNDRKITFDDNMVREIVLNVVARISGIS